MIEIQKNIDTDEILIKFIPIDIGILEKAKIIFYLILGRTPIYVEAFNRVSVKERFIIPIERLINE